MKPVYRGESYNHKRKLTLSVDEGLVAWAKKKGINLSGTFEEYLRLEREKDGSSS